MSIQRLSVALIKRLGAAMLGGLVLWQVAGHSGPGTGQAIVHVAMPKVEITVGDETYWVETAWERPIVCELRPGRHTIRMVRSGRILYAEEFTIAVGQELVLIAWDQSADKGQPKADVIIGAPA
jgi:hypothetical protein